MGDVIDITGTLEKEKRWREWWGLVQFLAAHSGMRMPANTEFYRHLFFDRDLPPHAALEIGG